MAISVSLLNFFRKYNLEKDFYLFYNSIEGWNQTSLPIYVSDIPYKYYLPLKTPIKGYKRIVVSSNAANYIEKNISNLDLTRLRIKFMPWPEIVLVSERFHRSVYHQENDCIQDVLTRFEIKGEYMYSNHIPSYSTLNFMGIKQNTNFEIELPLIFNKSFCNYLKSNNLMDSPLLPDIRPLRKNQITELRNKVNEYLDKFEESGYFDTINQNLCLDVDEKMNISIDNLNTHIITKYDREGEIEDEFFHYKKGHQYFIVYQDYKNDMKAYLYCLIDSLPIINSLRKEVDFYTRRLCSYLSKKYQQHYTYFFCSNQGISCFNSCELLDDEKVSELVTTFKDPCYKYFVSTYMTSNFFESLGECEQYSLYNYIKPNICYDRIKETLCNLWIGILELEKTYNLDYYLDMAIIRQNLYFEY